MDTGPVATHQLDDLDNPSYGLIFGVRRSIRYHERRRAWFEAWHNLAWTLSFFGSSAAAAAIFGQWSAEFFWFPVAVAILLAADLVVGFSRKATLHHLLGRRFAALERSIPLRSLSAEEYQWFNAQRLEIEQDEPPVKRLLDVLCHYALLRSLGGTKRDLRKMDRISRWRQFSANLWSHEGYIAKLEDSEDCV